MSDLLIELFIFLGSALTLWWGTGLVVGAVSSLSKSLNISTFTISFFILGLMTSLPELSIGATAVSRGESPIAIGNLIGATLVIFLLIIPLLGVLGHSVALPKTLHRPQLALALSTILAPALLIADRSIHAWEGFLLVALYIVLFIALSRRESLYEKILERISGANERSKHRFLKIVVGLGAILVASTYMVNSAEFFAYTFNWSPFVVGLVIVALGTNIPELSLVLRSVISGKSDIALADYIGSAAANSLLIGVFAIITQGGIQLPNQALVRIIILVSTLVLFYIFIRSEKKLTQKESFILLLIYVIFVVIEIGQA